MQNELFIILLVAIAGGLGAMLRYGVDRSIMRRVHRAGGIYPWGITAVNLLGSFALGALLGAGVLTPLLGAGLLGGFTTFSTATVDTLRLTRAKRPLLALLNSAGMLLGAVILATLGYLAGQFFSAAALGGAN